MTVPLLLLPHPTYTYAHTHTVETHRRELCALREDLHSAKEALALMDSQHGLIREVSTHHTYYIHSILTFICIAEVQ